MDFGSKRHFTNCTQTIRTFPYFYTMRDELYLFSEQSLTEQAKIAPTKLGYALVRFFIDEHGQPSKVKTEAIGDFYLSPSGGTLRDKDMNIVTYSARYDMYKGLGRVKSE